jgi:hypothetical protein
MLCDFHPVGTGQATTGPFIDIGLAEVLLIIWVYTYLIKEFMTV